jgi:orotate phosphoribosyltransferase
MSTAREKLLQLLAHKSFRLGQFTLSSGAQSDYYIDGGLTLGADPIVVAAAALSAELNADLGTSGPLPAFIVRKQEKQHGTGQRIEGFSRKGARVVVVDDVCTTGGSTVQAIEAARAAGMEVVGALVLVDREEQNGRANVEKAASPAPFVALFTTTEIRAAHQRLR